MRLIIVEKSTKERPLSCSGAEGRKAKKVPGQSLEKKWEELAKKEGGRAQLRQHVPQGASRGCNAGTEATGK